MTAGRFPATSERICMSPFTSVRAQRALGTGVVVALTSGLLALSPVTAQAAEPTGPRTVTGGTIGWGVKASWRNYLKMSFVESTTTAIAPATDDLTTTTFGQASGIWKPADFSVKAAGGVHFTGHQGALDLTISNPELKRTGSTTQLLVDAIDSDDVTHEDLAIADVDLAAATITTTDTAITVTGATTALTEEGAGLFSSGGTPFYAPGTALDPLNLTLSLIGTPTVAVSKTQLLTDETATVTVTGSGFDPAAAIATRDPLTGRTGGVYVAFGKYADPWRPSASAPSGNRKNVGASTKWAVLSADIAAVGGAARGAIELKPDGTFTTELTVSKAQADAIAGLTADHQNYGIYTYPGGGATNAAWEIATPITFT